MGAGIANVTIDKGLKCVMLDMNEQVWFYELDRPCHMELFILKFDVHKKEGFWWEFWLTHLRDSGKNP